MGSIIGCRIVTKVKIGRRPKCQFDGFRLAEPLRLHLSDLDNNGGLDLLMASTGEFSKTIGGLIWLGDEKADLKVLAEPVGGAQCFDAIDLNTDGRLDLIGFSTQGDPYLAINHGTKTITGKYSSARGTDDRRSTHKQLRHRR